MNRTTDQVSVSGVEYVKKIPPAPLRPDDAHKGTFGSVLVVAGSEGMSGAANLAGRAALHGGAGLVTIAIPRSISSIVATMYPAYMTLPLEDDAGKIATAAIPQLETVLGKQTVMAIGPGLGQSAQVTRVVQHAYANFELPLILDADGINAFVPRPNSLGDRSVNSPRILTPHPGEFSRLTGLSTKEIQSNRAQLAIDFAKQHHVTLVLKGAGTVITDGEKFTVNPTGTSGMATGGSGDLLTGLIASFLAQGMTAFDAAQLGACFHGVAGELAKSVFGEQYMTAVEIAETMSHAWIAWPDYLHEDFRS